MHHTERILLGLLLIIIGLIALWYGSPARTGEAEPVPVLTWTFVMFFALGFIIGSMGLLGSEDDYPAFVSGLVLYFIVGALIAVFLYVRGYGIGEWTVYDADQPDFWVSWIKLATLWPLELVRASGLLGYDLML